MKKDSEYIKEFLDFLRQSDVEMAIASSIESDMDNATQDILHHIELQECTYYEDICLCLELRRIRQERRKAKDKVQELSRIQEWIAENQKTIKGLEKLLGETRKIEKAMKGRSYQPRTDALMRALLSED